MKVDAETFPRAGTRKAVSLSNVYLLDSIVLTRKPAGVLKYFIGLVCRK